MRLPATAATEGTAGLLKSWRSGSTASRSGGIGRRGGLKIRCPQGLEGSSPSFGTKEEACWSANRRASCSEKAGTVSGTVSRGFRAGLEHGDNDVRGDPSAPGCCTRPHVTFSEGICWTFRTSPPPPHTWARRGRLGEPNECPPARVERPPPPRIHRVDVGSGPSGRGSDTLCQLGLGPHPLRLGAWSADLSRRGNRRHQQGLRGSAEVVVFGTARLGIHSRWHECC